MLPFIYPFDFFVFFFYFSFRLFGKCQIYYSFRLVTVCACDSLSMQELHFRDSISRYRFNDWIRIARVFIDCCCCWRFRFRFVLNFQQIFAEMEKRTLLSLFGRHLARSICFKCYLSFNTILRFIYIYTLHGIYHSHSLTFLTCVSMIFTDFPFFSTQLLRIGVLWRISTYQQQQKCVKENPKTYAQL